MARSPVLDRTERSITFRVDDVKPAGAPLAEVEAPAAWEALANTRPEAASDWTGRWVADVKVHPLVAAVHLAFSQHRPLVLSPDAVWLTIVQGLAQHVQQDPEGMRAKLGVTHAGKAELSVASAEFAGTSPENPWPELFHGLAGQVRKAVGPGPCDLVQADFSTSGPVERAVSALALLDVYQRYFDYVCVCICGIPAVTLEGTADDWARLEQKARGLARLGLEWWTGKLVPVCAQMAAAARGEVDLAHWQRLYKVREAYGTEEFNGWLAWLFPYTWGGRNPTLDDPKAAISTEAVPLGLSAVPLSFKDLGGRELRRVEMLGGLVGVTQDARTLALRPRVGWAVRAARLEQAIARLVREHQARPVAKVDPDRGFMDGMPRELVQLWAACDGAITHGGGGARIFAQSESQPFNPSRRVERHRDGSMSLHPVADAPSVDLFPFARLRDGSTLALQAELRWKESTGPRRVLRLPKGRLPVDLGAWRVCAPGIAEALEAILAASDPPLADLGPAFP